MKSTRYLLMAAFCIVFFMASMAWPANAGTANGSFSSGPCRAGWGDGRLTVGNGLFTRTYEFRGGVPRTISFALDGGTDWQRGGKDGTENALDEMTVEAKKARWSPVGVEGVCVNISSKGRETELWLFPGVPGLVAKRKWTDSVKPVHDHDRDFRRLSEDGKALRGALEAADCLKLMPQHIKATSVVCMDQTDIRDNLMPSVERLLMGYDTRFTMAASALDCRDVLTGNGLVFVRLAPMPVSRPEPVEDFILDGANRQVALLANGYPLVELAYRGGDAGRQRALVAFQRAIRPYRAGRDGILLSNTWGGGNRDSRINQAFLLKEIDAGAKIGVDVIQVDDGWESGRTSNSERKALAGRQKVWNGYWDMDPDFWKEDRERFPDGLDFLVKKAAEKGMRFGLWYGPDSSNDAVNWEKDVDCLLDFHRRLGIDYFKLDSMKLYTPLALKRNRMMFDRLQKESGGAMVFDLDCTAEIRPGFLGLLDVGPMFVENRYTRRPVYWPHHTLKNLWDLSHLIDPVRLRMEFNNPDTNHDNYKDSPLGHGNYRPDALFATVMAASPLAWMELSDVSEKSVAALAPLVKTWKAERARWHGGVIHPVGKRPDGMEWTGFVSEAADGDGGYALLFRELNPSSGHLLDLSPFFGNARPAVAEVIGGRGSAALEGNALKVDISEKLDFIWVKLRRLGDASCAGLSPDEFRDPPPEARPHTWWHWMNGNVTKEGITADLEAMAAAGIGGAQIFDAGLALPKGPVDFATDAWFDCLVHADREAYRLGIELCIANCSGWTSSGGPWITPELSMKFATATTTTVKGGERFDGVLPLPENTNGFYEDIAVLAFPTPANGKAVLCGMPDFDLQVFRGRGSASLGGSEMGPQMPVKITDRIAPPESCVAGGEVVDLTALLRPNNALAWDAPPSHASWTILRIGYAANGRTNRSCSRAGLGLECDKLDPHALDVHFDAYVGKLLQRLPKNHALKGVLLDSYEVHGQNWTRGFDRMFAAETGYSITNFLPVLAGFPVGNAAETEKFLKDFRRVISSLFVRNYAGRLRERCRENGLAFYCEPYGNGPFNDLDFARECDIPMSEFWRPRNSSCDLAALARDKGSEYMVCRWGSKPLGNSKTVASTAHVWGRQIVGAEAFTSYPDEGSGRWQVSPYAMKLQCDRVFTEGVNRMIFHRFVHQPWTNPTRYPGMTMAAYGAHIDRTQTWWEHGAKEFFTYMSRAQHLLQQGTFVGDVLLCTSGEAPDYGTDGEMPEGYDGDRCHPSALSAIKVLEGGDVVVPGGTRYRVIGTPPLDTLRSEIVGKLNQLKAAGAAIVEYGEVPNALKRLGCTPDFTCDDRDVTWIHRRAGDDDFYFLAVPNKQEKTISCSFRVADRMPELWNPVTGEITPVTQYGNENGHARFKIDCPPLHSVFVVFRNKCRKGNVQCKMKVAGTVPVAGPWQVAFREPGKLNDIAAETFADLISWTECENEDIRYFSGTAAYKCRIDDMKYKMETASGNPSGTVPMRIVLDLGRVADIAEVSVNGRAYPALWCPPYKVDITDAVVQRPCSSSVVSLLPFDLEVKVTNRWPNRLIGDMRLPDDCEWDDGANSKGFPLVKAWPEWLLRGAPSPAGRHAFTTCRLWTAGEPLLESGLLGPVSIEFCGE